MPIVKEGNDPLIVREANCAGETFKPEDCNFADLAFNCAANFEGAIFEGLANFNIAEFWNKVVFSKAIFKNGANFSDSIFRTHGEEISFANASFEQSDSDIDFSGAYFGLPYDQYFDDWKIAFRITGGGDLIQLSKSNSFDRKEQIRNFELTDGRLSDKALKELDLEKYQNEIREAFTQFKQNPGRIRFSNTTFENDGSVYFKNAQFHNRGSILFDRKTTFKNTAHVDFDGSIFNNGGEIRFSKAVFYNQGTVSFSDISFACNGSIRFDQVKFRNKDTVDFDGTSFNNRTSISFQMTSFANGGHTTFRSVSYNKKSDIGFSNAMFINGGDVTFEKADFHALQKQVFRKVIWANNGKLDFLPIDLQEKLDLKFYECLFLSRKGTDFSGVRFPEKGSVMFHRCHFDSIDEVGFSSANFHQAVFEGGPIGWLEEYGKGNISICNILKSRGITPTEWMKDISIPIHTSVFADGFTVNFQNLTTESAKNLNFRMVNLSGSIFDGVTLKHIELNAPSWEIQDGRYILHAEKELWKKTTGFGKLKPGIDEKSFHEELRNVANQCTQLKSNLEGYRDFRTAGDFHFGEQEILRKGYPWLENEISIMERILRAFFHLSSGYGERPLWAAGATFSLLIGFTVISLLAQDYMGVHLKEIWGGNEAHTEIAHFWKTMGHILSPFWKSASIKDIGSSNWGYYIYLFFAKVTIYAQSTMLILAIRRRFKR